MSELFQELKRRNVVRVGAAYAVVGWLVLQVVDTVAPLMGMPEWVPGFILILIGVGFPLSLVFAWAYEITPDGLMKTEDVDVTRSVTAETGRKIDRMIIGGLAVLVLFLVTDRVLGLGGGGGGGSAVAEDASIAVLPFVNLSSDAEQEFFSDGISEELLNVLAQVPELRVAARTSSFQFKGDNRDITDIARELNVRHVLEGSVRKDGGMVRITAQLIDAADGFHLWSNTYDRSLENVFAVQDEISIAIVDALRDELGLIAEVVARDASTDSPEAHEAYLRGRHLVVQRTRLTIEAAIESFQRAVELDPDYALAHAELSLAWHLMARTQYGDLTDAEVLERAEPSASRAVALSESLAEAHAARGFVEWQRMNYEPALSAFATALDINPNYAEVQTWIGNLLDDDLGQYQEAFEATVVAAELNPLSIPALANLARDQFEAGDLEGAEAALDKLAPLSPPFALHIRAEAMSRRGEWADGARQQLEALTLDPTSARISRFLSFDFTRLGLYEEVEAINPALDHFQLMLFGDKERELAWVEEWIEEDPEAPTPRSALGLSLAGAGDFERALPVLEESYERSGRNVTRFGLFTPAHAVALVAARGAAGIDDSSDLVEAAEDHSRRYEEAGITFGLALNDRALAAWIAGDHERALELFAQSVGRGAILFDGLAYLQDLYDAPGYAPIRARYLERQARERADFLASVCTENPWAAVWTPLPGTCPND